MFSISGLPSRDAFMMKELFFSQALTLVGKNALDHILHCAADHSFAG